MASSRTHREHGTYACLFTTGINIFGVLKNGPINVNAKRSKQCLL